MTGVQTCALPIYFDWQTAEFDKDELNKAINAIPDILAKEKEKIISILKKAGK